jgi:PEP-CTERM motif
MTRTCIGLTLILLSACFGLTPARATDYYQTDVVNVDYGVETVLNRNGAVVGTYDLITADTDGTASLPTGLITEVFPGLISQLMSDPQEMALDLPSFVLPGLTDLEDDNGFGLFNNDSVVPNPAVTAFDAQLAANAGGPFYITADTGFQIPLIVETAAYCDFVNETNAALGLPACVPQNPPATTDEYELTYQLPPTPPSGLTSYDGNNYEELVNFQLFYRNVTVQAAPEPSTWALILIGFAGLGYLGYRRRRDFAAVASK